MASAFFSMNFCRSALDDPSELYQAIDSAVRSMYAHPFAAAAAFARASFVDRERPAVKLAVVLVCDRRIELVGVDVHESKSATLDDTNRTRSVGSESLKKC